MKKATLRAALAQSIALNEKLIRDFSSELNGNKERYTNQVEDFRQVLYGNKLSIGG